MFAIEVQHVFHAGHQLRLPASMGGGVEPYHEHDWHVTVRVEAAKLDELETVMDFHELERLLGGVCGEFAGKNINEVPPFAEHPSEGGGQVRNPSAERIAGRIGELLQASLYKDGGGLAAEVEPRVRLTEVRITEAAGCLAIWRVPNR